ncbi:MAG TPA: ferritin-like domain-containing protein [Vicinamibacterales bacterium]|nr:ferritin-like domain-containing protein [Vicinamibacterales bacterium]
MSITTLADLRTRLQWAIEIEHSIIPPYLCALYSIKPGLNREAVEALTSVFIEEMLHMTLAANVLNAIGGAPVLDQPGFIPTYPQTLPHSRGTFLIPLARFSRATIETFMRIENPEAPGAAPQTENYATQGQFYLAIEEALQALCAAHGEPTIFCGDPSRQITPESLDYNGSGRVIAVYDLASALAAINEIEEQGEGATPKEVWDGDRDMFHPEADEVAHFFRYQEVQLGRFYQRGDTPASGPTGRSFVTDWDAVYPMRDNPSSADYAPGTPVREKMDAFNRLYSDMLRGLHRAFNGEPKHMFMTVRAMTELKARAQELMQLPSGDGVTTAGPSFEWVAPTAIAAAATAPAASAASAAAPDAPFSITVQKDGPYLVAGGVPLTRKSIVYSEWHEPMSWRKDAELGAKPFYKLCRCGQSKHKPYCDNTHTKIGFDGAETAPIEPSAARQQHLEADHITVHDDRMLCTRAGFCGNRVTNIWKQLERADDSRLRFDVIQRIERCPSGRLSYDVGAGPVEPDLPRAIAVTRDGPYWVTGGIAVTMSDGRTIETRNRVDLCRCGHSSIKPLCDGSHRDRKFTEG